MPGVGQAPQEAPQWQAAGPCLAPVLTYPTRATLVPYTSVILFSCWAHYQPLHPVICQRLGSRLLSSVITAVKSFLFFFCPIIQDALEVLDLHVLLYPRVPQRGPPTSRRLKILTLDCEVTIRVAQIVEHNCTLFLCSLDVRNKGDQCRVSSIKEKDHLAG